MSDTQYELSNAIVALVTAAILYIAPLVGLFIALSSVGFLLWSTRKYVKDCDIGIEYWLLIVAAVLFAGAYFVPNFKMTLFYLGLSLIIRFLFTAYLLVDNTEIELAKKDAVNSVKNMYEKRIADLEHELDHSISEEEVREKVNMLALTLKKEQEHKILEIEKHYTKLLEAGHKSENSIRKIKEQRDREIADAREQISLEVEKAVEIYRYKIEKLNCKLREAESKLSEKNTTIQKHLRENERLHKENQKLLAERESLLTKQSDLIAKLEANAVDNLMIHNEEIHRKLIEILNSATKEIDIMSPWISERIIKEVEPYINKAVKRKVVIKIVYGIENAKNSEKKREKMKQSDERLKEAKDVISRLRRQYGSSYIKAQYMSSHSKLIICDELYYVITSCNPLSNAGDCWEEIGEVSNNKKNLKAYRESYFSF